MPPRRSFHSIIQAWMLTALGAVLLGGVVLDIVRTGVRYTAEGNIQLGVAIIAVALSHLIGVCADIKIRLGQPTVSPPSPPPAE